MNIKRVAGLEISFNPENKPEIKFCLVQSRRGSCFLLDSGKKITNADLLSGRIGNLPVVLTITGEKIRTVILKKHDRDLNFPEESTLKWNENHYQQSHISSSGVHTISFMNKEDFRKYFNSLSNLNIVKVNLGSLALNDFIPENFPGRGDSIDNRDYFLHGQSISEDFLIPFLSALIYCQNHPEISNSGSFLKLKEISSLSFTD